MPCFFSFPHPNLLFRLFYYKKTIFRESDRKKNFIDCTVTKTSAYPDPNYLHLSPPIDQWFCAEEAKDYISHRLNGDVESLLKNRTVFNTLSHSLHFEVPKDMLITSEDQVESYVDLDSVDVSLINVFEHKQNKRGIFKDNKSSDEFNDEDFKGEYTVLIMRVEDNRGNTVSQSEEDLYNDFFVKETNLVRIILSALALDEEILEA